MCQECILYKAFGSVDVLVVHVSKSSAVLGHEDEMIECNALYVSQSFSQSILCAKSTDCHEPLHMLMALCFLFTKMASGLMFIL